MEQCEYYVYQYVDGRYAKASATLKGKPWSTARRLAQTMRKKAKEI